MSILDSITTPEVVGVTEGMSQAEINAYFIAQGYSETGPDSFENGPYKYETTPEQLSYFYDEWVSVILNVSIADEAYLAYWIQKAIDESTHPPVSEDPTDS